jgi:hypothetical protein
MLIIQSKCSAVKQSKKEDFLGQIVNGKLLLPGNDNFYIKKIINSFSWLNDNIQVPDTDLSFTRLCNTALIESHRKPCLSIENKPIKTSVAKSW